ncbi:hypothetical protein MSG28_006091 [Choristoneura fumiferana]|uniref:Uncharacterized protein n=1 Tax=Choristoneura fumiferana TaxID=7141 RepID=A0ACC0JDF0_CHOFU|nr:hypothetical protein MSG28_006091 [Choristoneura fumiferana]
MTVPPVLPPCVPINCGKDFRQSLKKPSPNYPHGQKARKPRLVPAFTIQAMQKNTRVIPPKKSGLFDLKPLKPSMFRRSYSRGEFPVTIEFTNFGKRLSWKVPIEKLDFHHYLPMFFDGMGRSSVPVQLHCRTGHQRLGLQGILQDPACSTATHNTHQKCFSDEEAQRDMPRVEMHPNDSNRVR